MFATPTPGSLRAVRVAGAVHLMGRRCAIPARDVAPTGAAAGHRASCPGVDEVRAIGIPHAAVGESVRARVVPVHDAVGRGCACCSFARRPMVSIRISSLARASGDPQCGCPTPRRALERSDALEATATSL